MVRGSETRHRDGEHTEDSMAPVVIDGDDRDAFPIVMR